MFGKRFVSASIFAAWTAVVYLQAAALSQTSLPSSEKATSRAGPIVLRDLTLIRDDPIRSFDERGVVLNSQKRIGWSKILKAEVDKHRQAEFDRYLNEVGLPLFRLESRLAKRDWAAIGEIAEPLYEKLRSGSLTANEELKFLICRATMESRLFNSRRMEAIEPFLRAAAHQTRLDSDTRSSRTESLLPSTDVAQMVSEQILPIWFDGAKAAVIHRQLSESIENSDVGRTSGAHVYLASLAVAAEHYELADQLISEIKKISSGRNENADWATVVAANRHLSSGETGQGRQLLKWLVQQPTNPDDPSAAKAVAVYLAGAHRDNEAAETQMLNLITVPAIYGNRYPSLSAAALYKAFAISRKKTDLKQSRILVNELLRRYPNTYHGRMAAIEK